MSPHDLFRRFVEVPRTTVIAQPGPEIQNFLFGGLSQGLDIGESLEEAVVIRNDCLDLCLLQHDF